MPPLVYARPVHNASLSSWSIESRKQCIQQLYRILRILNTNTDRTGLNRGIVITRRRHAITHEHHFIGPYAKCLRQLAHGIGLIDAAFADIHTGVSAGPGPHMRQIGLDRFDQRLFLRVIAIPCLLGRYGRELPKSGEGDLAAPVLDSRPPYLLFPQSQFPGMSLKTFRDSGHGGFGQIMRIHQGPLRAIR